MELVLLLLAILALFIGYIFLAACWRIILGCLGMLWGLGWLAVMTLRASWSAVSYLARRA